MNNKQCGIYKIENKINNKKYIGLSLDILNRWKEHKKGLSENKHHNRHLQRAWNKYGEENIIFEIIELCDKEKLNQREVFYIHYYKTNNRKYGFNMNTGGGLQLGFKHSQKSKNLISKIQIGRKRNPEASRKTSEALKGKIPKNINIFLQRNIDISKPILCFDKKAQLINKYKSIQSCSKDLNIPATNIVKCLKNFFKTCGKFVFIYENQYNKEMHTENNIKKRFHREETPKNGVEVYNLEGIFIKKYNTIIECSKELNIDRHIITDCCLLRRKNYKNFIFKYIS